jgi:hypothetical protein
MPAQPYGGSLPFFILSVIINTVNSFKIKKALQELAWCIYPWEIPKTKKLFLISAPRMGTMRVSPVSQVITDE